MKTRILYIILLSVYLVPFSSSFGQNSYERQIKYWYLRDRLRHFIVPSEDPSNDPGTYLIITSRNRNWEDHLDGFTEVADYGQQMSAYGKYIGVLATEYHLLNSWGRYLEADNTNNELLLALEAYERLDLCEHDLDPALPDALDGFFIRHDVPENTLYQYNPFIIWSDLNVDRGILIEEDQLWDVDGLIREVEWVDGGMTPFKEWMSQDEACFLLEGLALAYKFGSTEVKANAKLYAHLVLNRMFGFISYGIHMGNWWIHNHYGIPIPIFEGGNCRSFSFGYAKAATDFFGLPGYVHFPGTEFIWAALGQFGTGGSDGHMVAGIAAISKGWGSATQSGIYKNTDQDGWDYYYLWLYKALWNESGSYYNVDRIMNRLDEGSCVGPWARNTDEHAVHGWGAPDRWRYNIGNQCVDGQPGGIGIYSGLDYMILLNLFYINNGDGLTRYRNRITTLLDQDWPQGSVGSVCSPYSIEAFRKVISTDHLLNTPLAADVSYKAGESIILNPGFKVEHGAHFHAKPEPIDYCTTLPINHGSCTTKDSFSTLNQDNKGVSKRDYNDYYEMNYNKSSSGRMINENLGQDVIVYPNPSNEIVYIENVDQFNSYRLHSSHGEILLEGIISSHIFSIDLSSFQSGIYVLFLQSISQTCIRRISIIH